MTAGASNWPELRAKAHNAALVCRWLASFVEDLVGPDTLEFKLLRICLRSHTRVQDIMASAERHFTADEAQEFLAAGLMMLRAWARLTRLAELQREKRWQLKPKHHHWEEGLYWAFETRPNPRHNCAYKHESFVGLIARISAMVHVSLVSKRTAQRWLLRYRDLP